MGWLYRTISILAGWTAARMFYNLRWEQWLERQKLPQTRQELDRLVEAFTYRMWYDTLWYGLTALASFGVGAYAAILAQDYLAAYSIPAIWFIDGFHIAAAFGVVVCLGCFKAVDVVMKGLAREAALAWVARRQAQMRRR